MSSRYDVAVVLTLKLSVSPTLTLISVAKPWMVVLPEPLTSQVLLGVPGLLFSQATGLARGAQGSAAASVPTKIGRVDEMSRMSAQRRSAFWQQKKAHVNSPPRRAFRAALIVTSLEITPAMSHLN